MAYSDKVLDHYNTPRNVGAMDKSSDDVGTGVVGAPECGDVMKLQIKVEKEEHEVISVTQEAGDSIPVEVGHGLLVGSGPPDSTQQDNCQHDVVRDERCVFAQEARPQADSRFDIKG